MRIFSSMPNLFTSFLVYMLTTLYKMTALNLAKANGVLFRYLASSFPLPHNRKLWQ
jgi:hypothetical protein